MEGLSSRLTLAKIKVGDHYKDCLQDFLVLCLDICCE